MRAPAAAVLTIDLHRGAVEPPGTVFVPGAAERLGVVRRLLAAAREIGRPVIHVVHQLEPDGSDRVSPLWRESTTLPTLYPNAREQVRGSRWTELPEALGAEVTDKVFPKKRYGAFSGNGLLFHLRAIGAETLVLTGTETEICVLATAFEAFNNDFRVIVAADGVAGFEEPAATAALRIVERELGHVATVDDIVDALRAEAAATT